MGNPVREFFSGVGILFQGAGIVMRSPKLFGLGVIPPLITSLLFVSAFVALLWNIGDLTTWMTPFADGWGDTGQTAVRVTLGVALVAAAILIVVVAFTGVTLALGFPLYDKIAELVEEELGEAPPEDDEPIVQTAVRSLRQSIGVILVSALVTVPLFLAGFIPVVGQTVIPVISAMFGGWMLTIELLGAAFDRRGLRRIKDRRKAMRQRRMLVFGFGIPSYVLLAIPFLAIVVFPAATAGGTVLARRLLATGPQQAQPHPGHLPPNTPGGYPPGHAGPPPGPPSGPSRQGPPPPPQSPPQGRPPQTPPQGPPPVR